MSIILRDRFFFLIVFTAMFSQIPDILQVKFLGSFMQEKLSIYPVVLAFGYYCWKYKEGGINFSLTEIDKRFLIYITVYLLVTLISFFHGMFIYPYYDAILAGPANQIEKFPTVYQFLIQAGIPISEITLFKIWMIARPIKNVILECFWFFSIPLLIYLWFKKDIFSGINILKKAAVVSILCISLYGILDIFYLNGSFTAQVVLAQINPIIHTIKVDGSGWPPLLWNDQLRSLFAEPSFFGMYAAFATPWLWYAVSEQDISFKKRIALSFLLFLFTYELFLARARTATSLFVGEIVLLLLIALWQYEKRFFRNTMKLLLISLFAFCLATFSISYMPGSPEHNGLDTMGYNKNGLQNVAVYLEDNIGSLASSNQRKQSNLSRYSILKASVAIGEDYPILGVGRYLRDAYIPDYLPPEAFEGEEIQSWLHAQKEKGILKSGFPPLGEYCTRFAETGTLGLLVYLLPSAYLLIQLLRRISSAACRREEKEKSIFLFLSMMGVMASGLSNSFSVNCCYWILIGIGYAFIMPEQQSKPYLVKR